MKTVNDMVRKLKQQQAIVIPTNQVDLIPDLVFTLDVLCIPHRRRDIESLKDGVQTRIELRS